VVWVRNPLELQDLKDPVGGQEPFLQIAVAYVEVKAEQHAGDQSGQGADVRAFRGGSSGARPLER